MDQKINKKYKTDNFKFSGHYWTKRGHYWIKCGQAQLLESYINYNRQIYNIHIILLENIRYFTQCDYKRIPNQIFEGENVRGEDCSEEEYKS